ncbi:MAG: glycosyltransferase, partial [Candidatus Cloacimonadaceae bacterium]|nr:glycosyltransferase [Candidatus Cloacimonadaceae bacterium]
MTHSIAHASYSVNGKLQIHHLEKLILLFDHFEIINGGRNKLSNQGWETVIRHLDENKLHDMYIKHRIEPFGKESWIKGFTGGSDDHGGLFLGKTFTKARANSIDEFLSAIRNKKSSAAGRHNSFHALAFTVYKIAYDFSKENGSKRKNPSLLGSITENLFDNKTFDLKNRIKLNTYHKFGNWHSDKLKLCLGDLISLLQENRKSHLEDKLDAVYTQISNITDTFFAILLNSLEEDIKDINLVKIIRNISSSLPGVFMLLPFFSSLKHMHQTLNLVDEFRELYAIPKEPRKRRTLWFTDTINDLNGVSVTLKQMGQIAWEKGRELRIVSSLTDHEITDEIPDSYMNLPFIYEFRLPFYESYKIRIPSILSSLKAIDEFEPDQIIISTPGPVGLLALLAAKLLQVPCIGIYHTDFFSEAKHIIPDESHTGMILSYERWFYNQMDEVRAPTTEYLNILQDREINVSKTGLLLRGIETDRFEPFEDRKSFLRSKYSYREGITLLYAGRVSKDKSLELLANVYIQLCKKYDNLNLIVCGNGPYLSEMKQTLVDYDRVIFTGSVPRNLLPNLYNAADYFVFTSETDTFGMVILES